MPNKTFIPAFTAKVGDWPYYICIMKYAEVARQVNFAYELGGNRDLSTLIQRGISLRTEGIVRYLLESEHRFLGAMIVATWGGDPEYVPLQMDDPEGMLKDLDRGFGVLTLDGTHQFFALDGQHRLKAIKDAVKKRPELGSEDIAVLLVSHYETANGRERTRRLFTNINRNAKATTQAENIALDVDDGYAVLTRDFLTADPFWSKEGVVLVFTRIGEDGDVTLAGSSVPKTHKSALTTISVFYEFLKSLGFGLDPTMTDLSRRPSDLVIEQSAAILAERLSQLLKSCGNIQDRLLATANARDLRAPKDDEASGHAFMRPVVQRAVARVLRHVVEQGRISWDDAMAELAKLDWKIGSPPWLAVFSTETKSMIAGKDFSDLLSELLEVHLAPPSHQQIKRIRKRFRDLRGFQYPVSEDVLAERIKEAEPIPVAE